MTWFLLVDCWDGIKAWLLDVGVSHVLLITSLGFTLLLYSTWLLYKWGAVQCWCYALDLVSA